MEGHNEHEELSSLNETNMQLMTDQNSAKFLPLRHSLSKESSFAVGSGEMCTGITHVPVDWEFNDLLANVAKQMTGEDLEDMKTRVKGEGGLGRKVLETIRNANELFDVLQKYQFIDRDNVLMLQALLHRMHRNDLFELAVKYAQSSGNVIHFKKPANEPPNGFRYVQIHLEGPNFSQYKRSTLEAFRAHAARLMFVDPELVTIAGIEPSNSMLITLRIPERYIQYLNRAAGYSECLKEWKKFGVDYIRIEGKVYNLADSENPGIAKTEDQQRLETIFQKYEDIKGKLDSRDAEILNLKRLLQKRTPRGDVQALVEEIIPTKRKVSTSKEFGEEGYQEKGIKDVCIRMRGDNWYKYIGGVSSGQTTISHSTATDTSMDKSDTISSSYM